MQEIKEFAPVIIPTLNRYEHFKRCLESLEQCTWADKTDVYVALDYPPSERYVDGWKKIDAYLAEKEQINGFHNLVIYRRKENYFFSGKGNLTSALKDLPERTGCYIITEDDNEFSPCFLDYMNKVLTRYWDDKRVTSVSGYNYPVDMGNYDKSIYAHHQYSAWGVGRWKHKSNPIPTELANQVLKSPSKMLKILRTEPNNLFVLMSMISHQQRWGDALYVASNILNGQYSIFPTVSLCRNHGHDGSGLHCGGKPEDASDVYRCQDISTESTFMIDDIEIKEADIPALKKCFGISFKEMAYHTKNYIKYLLSIKLQS